MRELQEEVGKGMRTHFMGNAPIGIIIIHLPFVAISLSAYHQQ
jgi:hypothetical protein